MAPKAAIGLFKPALKWLLRGAAKDTAVNAERDGAKVVFRDGARSAARTDAERAAARDAGRPLKEGTEGVPPEGRNTTRDPIDVATGEVLLPQTDVRLPGVLPMVLERMHLSSYRQGRLFGVSWASTLDQRLEIGPDGIRYAAPDGTIAVYPPVVMPGIALRPTTGPIRPLTPRPDGGYTIDDPKTGRTLHFPPRDGDDQELPLAAITDRNGNRIDLVYDESAALTEIRHSGGYRVAVETDGPEDRRRVIALRLLTADPGITLVRYGYDQAGNLTEITNSTGRPLLFTYDDEGRLTGWTDRNGHQYRYEYDAEGRAHRAYGTGGYLNATLTYDPDGEWTAVADSLGHRTTYRLDGHGQVVAETDPLGHTVRSEWDDRQRLVARTDATGAVTRYRYDDIGNVVEVVKADGSRVVVEYDERNKPVRVVDPTGAVWRSTFDERGNLTSTTDPLGVTTRYTVDERGAVRSVTNAMGASVQIATNPAGLQVATADSADATTRYDRDALGRVVAVTDPMGGVTRLGWTVEGWLTSRTAPSGAAEAWEYDAEGNTVSHTDAAGRTSRVEYGPFGVIHARSAPDGSRLEFQHDTELRLVSVTNAKRLSWQYAYDQGGNLLSETDFDGRTLRYTHDPAGRPATKTNGAGEVTQYTRDTLGRILEQRTAGVLTTFDYDAVGRLRRAVSPSADVQYRRDAVGRIVAETVNGRTVHSAFDALGRRTHRRTPSGADATWQYDAGGRPDTLTTGGQTLRFTRDAAGRETRRHIGLFAILDQQWNPDDRLTSQALWAAPAQGPDGAAEPRLIEHRRYGYEPGGDVTAIFEREAGTRRFDLDRVGRIAAVQAPNWTERYAYDQDGELTSAEWPEADTAGPREHQGTLLRRAGRVHYEYDAQGRLTTRRHRTLSGQSRVWRYEWGPDDRLVAVHTPDGIHWRYTYDPLGRRTGKYRMDGTQVVEWTEFAWDGLVLAEQAHNVQKDGVTHTRVTSWTHDQRGFVPLTQTERRPLAEKSQQWVDERFYAIVTDLLGTPTELIDERGDCAWRSRTTLWGAGATDARDTAGCPFRFAGQYHDAETGLHYNHHRYYSPLDGRYVSADPIGLLGGGRPHGYVRNPIHSTDPLGLIDYTPIENEAPLEKQRSEIQDAVDRGFTPTTLEEGAGIDALRRALGDESEFKWAVVPDGEGGAALKVMPVFVSGNGFPRDELTHTVLAGEGGHVYAAGSGSMYDNYPPDITNWTGHFGRGGRMPASTLDIGEQYFNRAGIDVLPAHIGGT